MTSYYDDYLQALKNPLQGLLRNDFLGLLLQICSDNWNQTQGFEVMAPSQNSNQGLGSVQASLYSATVGFKILQNAQTPVTNLKEWINQRLPPQNIDVIGGGNSGSKNDGEPFCEIASPTNSIQTFDGLKYNMAFAGIFNHNKAVSKQFIVIKMKPPNMNLTTL